MKRTRKDLSETEDSDEEASKKSPPPKPVSSKGKVSASDKDDVIMGINIFTLSVLRRISLRLRMKTKGRLRRPPCRPKERLVYAARSSGLRKSYLSSKKPSKRAKKNVSETEDEDEEEEEPNRSRKPSSSKSQVSNC